jgi:hypothetical protein
MEAKTCISCGADIEATHPHGLCPVCLLKGGIEETPTAALDCPACGDPLAAGSKFCAQCGTPLESGSGGEQSDPVRGALQAKLRGQYRLGRLLGRGGMGAVYLARDLALDRDVAIKVVRAVADTRQMHERFRREARTAARLSHPNIVPLHSFGEADGMPYFVMGFVSGESLADRLRRDGKLPEEEARRVLAEVADALDYAHRQGVVHRDVKPDNVLIEDQSGRALLTDFGLAKALGQGETMTGLGGVLGTPQYMSPEQASGQSDIDARSDLYSLGVMAYALVAGRLPFEGNTPAEMMRKHLTQEPAPLRAVAPGVSDAMARAIDRCLEKDPAARWPDARLLKLALGIDRETQLPDSLQAVEGKGPVGLLVTVTFMMLMALGAAEESYLLGLQIMMVLIFFTSYAFVVTRLRREGFSLGESQRAIWREPAWWPFWYPRALRRQGNVWERLPGTVRYLRWSIVAFAAYFAVFYVDIVLTRVVVGFFEPRFMLLPIGVAAFSTIVVAWIVLTILARRDLQRQGLGGADVQRIMLLAPPSRVGYWRRPHIAAILAPAAQPERGRSPESPHDHLQSILRQASELSGPLSPLGAQAAVAARQLVQSIDHIDREIAELARNLEPGEEERLVDKIEALSADSEDNDAAAPMRGLLEQQLGLIRSLSARIEEAKERRSRRVEMLRTLTLHMASLHGRLTKTPIELEEISDKVRALCDDIQGRALAQDPTIAADTPPV